MNPKGWFWWRRKEIEVPMPSKEEITSLAEAMGKGGLYAAMEGSIKNMVDASQNYMYESSDDQGNFFGSEFNIRATAGRIKATYTREPWINATAGIITRTLSTVPFKVVDVNTKETLPNHPLNRFLTMGNKLSDSRSMNWSGYLDLILGGNFFRVFNETYTECMQVPVEKCTMKLTEDKKDVAYLVVWDNIGDKKLIPWKQVVHHKFPNPYNPYYGISYFIALSRPLILDRYRNEFEMAFYLRGATNSGVIETTEDISKSRLQRLMATFEQMFTGKRNWGRTLFLPKGAKWVSSGLTMSQMEHLESMRENRKTMLAVAGVPPSKVGISEDVNRATSEVQDKTFYQNSIIPLAEFTAEGWNNSYLVRVIYGGRVRVEADLSKIEALQGSVLTKGDQSKAMENYFLIDEIRAKVWNEPPLPDGRGNKLVAEVRAVPSLGTLGLAIEGATPKVTEESSVTIDAPAPDLQIEEPKVVDTSSMKTQVTTSQQNIEEKYSGDFKDGFDSYIDKFLGIASYALRNSLNVEHVLKSKKVDLARVYSSGVGSTLMETLDRSFTFANSQSKSLSESTRVKIKSVKGSRFNEKDREAIDALKEEQANGQRDILAKRSISNFAGINETRTKEVLDLIAGELEKGRTADQVAANIRSVYGEHYPNQASVIARQEILSAVSQGIKWNQDVLGEVFTRIEKQWFHVGDVDSNPNARADHADFEQLGAVASNHKFGGRLDYPRDPQGDAGDVIGCRCSLVTVVPDDADSNAELILDRLS